MKIVEFYKENRAPINLIGAAIVLLLLLFFPNVGFIQSFEKNAKKIIVKELAKDGSLSDVGVVCPDIDSLFNAWESQYVVPLEPETITVRKVVTKVEYVHDTIIPEPERIAVYPDIPSHVFVDSITTEDGVFKIRVLVMDGDITSWEVDHTPSEPQNLDAKIMASTAEARKAISEAIKNQALNTSSKSSYYGQLSVGGAYNIPNSRWQADIGYTYTNGKFGIGPFIVVDRHPDVFQAIGARVQFPIHK